jgi:pyruvate/2-oxoglutarate dehydrogenase complex dihydrolipoamide acyltransferase (E2) component
MNPNVKEIIIPQIGEALEEEVIILQWKKNIGDTVSKEEILLEVESGKGTLELESPYDGVLIEIIIKEGQQVTPLTVVGRIESVSA